MLSLISFLPGTSHFGLIFEGAHAAPNQLQSGIRTSAPDWFELSIAQLIVRDKEVLDFVYDYGIELRDRFELGALMRGIRHSNQPIVPEGPPLLSLVSIDHSNRACEKKTSDASGNLDENEDVQRVSIFCQSRRHKPEVERKDHA